MEGHVSKRRARRHIAVKTFDGKEIYIKLSYAIKRFYRARAAHLRVRLVFLRVVQCKPFHNVNKAHKMAAGGGETLCVEIHG